MGIIEVAFKQVYIQYVCIIMKYLVFVLSKKFIDKELELICKKNCGGIKHHTTMTYNDNDNDYNVDTSKVSKMFRIKK